MTDTDYFATIDHERAERCGFSEVIFGEGKTPAQVAGIASRIAEAHQVVLVTRASLEHAKALQELEPDAQYVAHCRLLYIDRRDEPVRITGVNAEEILGVQERVGGVTGENAQAAAKDDEAHRAEDDDALLSQGKGRDLSTVEGLVVVCSAGTSDLPVAEEAAITARIMGSHTVMLADIGVAGVHRVLNKQELLQQARVVIAVAGMEGALPSVVAGLVDVPVIAVPTSVGYGASFGGIAALLGMLNSCAGGVSVVNIDNGFGAGQLAHRINAPRWLGM